MGVEEMRWFDADAGVLKSKIRRCESEETEERMEGEWGENAVLYVHEWVGRVRIEAGRVGDHYLSQSYSPRYHHDEGLSITILIVPSHELDAKVSLATKFQNTENTSRLCSLND